MKILLIGFTILLNIYASKAQSIPEVGKPIPDFTLDNITHYKTTQASVKDFKGKWLFLDFWFTGCPTCIYSFPKVSKLQKQFNDKIQFLLVGQNHKRFFKNVEQVFEKLRSKQGLDIASAYDSTLSNAWGIESMPHIVIVDPQGVVRFITDGNDMSKEKIQSLLNGEHVTFAPKDIILPSFEVKLTNSNADVFPSEKILGYTAVTKWNGEKTEIGGEISYNTVLAHRESGFKMVGATLEQLYCLAYLGKIPAILKFSGDSAYGKIYPFAITVFNDSVLTKSFSDFNIRYNYSLRIPSEKVTEGNIMLYMQQDLQRVFGYSAVVEERDMPAWKLVANEGTEQRIKTKGGLKYYSGNERSYVAGFTVRNVRMKGLTNYLFYYLNDKERHPFVDATGITTNIDFTIDADMTNIEDVKSELQKQGLDLILGKNKMKVLVIKKDKE